MNRLLPILCVVLLLAGAAAAQAGMAASVQTLIALPFENESKAPGLEWIGEAFTQVLEQRMASASMFVVPREDRVYAFDRTGIPVNLRPSRATLFRIAESMDADYVVLGRYTYDGQTFSAFAQLLDVKRVRLLPEQRESGTLLSLIEIQAALAWKLLRVLDPGYNVSRAEFLAASPPIRLDAFENYTRGITAATRQEKLRYLRVAVRLNPGYSKAMMELGRTYFEEHEYESAASWFMKIPRTDPLATEANFYAGLSYYYRSDFARAADCLNFLISRFPLTEVYNNLGVVESRRGKPDAIKFLQKAVQADPNDADYRFNLGLAFYRKGDMASAIRQWREAARLQPADAELRLLLDSTAQRGTTPAKVPPDRIKHNYDESSFRQLAQEIQNTTELRLANLDPQSHAAYHVDHAQHLLDQGFRSEAGRELREAIQLDPTNAAAHAGLARVLAADDPEAARAEARTALRLKPLVQAYLVLGELDLRDNKIEEAAKNLALALQLEPGSTAAADLKAAIAAKLTEKAQPLPTQ